MFMYVLSPLTDYNKILHIPKQYICLGMCKIL